MNFILIKFINSNRAVARYKNFDFCNLNFYFERKRTMDPIEKLTKLFAEFPTIGSRTARRFVFYLLKLPKENIDELIKAIQEVKQKVILCKFCFQPFTVTTNQNLCEICSNRSRTKELLCIVEKETDLLSIENTKRYHGLYFILGGNMYTTKKNYVESLRIKELIERAKNPQTFEFKPFSEIIIATNPTPEGRATSVLVERALKESGIQRVKITHLAQGLPVGGELEYADDETLESAFEGRK